MKHIIPNILWTKQRNVLIEVPKWGAPNQILLLSSQTSLRKWGQARDQPTSQTTLPFGFQWFGNLAQDSRIRSSQIRKLVGCVFFARANEDTKIEGPTWTTVPLCRCQTHTARFIKRWFPQVALQPISFRSKSLKAKIHLNSIASWLFTSHLENICANQIGRKNTHTHTDTCLGFEQFPKIIEIISLT